MKRIVKLALVVTCSALMLGAALSANVQAADKPKAAPAKEAPVKGEAAKPADKEAAKVVKQIEQASGRKVEAVRRVDPDLIGGIVIQAGSQRLDASVRGRLDQLRQELTARS